ncbi:MAG: hypothetical protein M3Y56_09250 [Armatimonadota bacterium]|nr:hypothetical protein [Armatimonadota bacterium]
MPVFYRLLTALAPACALLCLSMPACPASPSPETARSAPAVSRYADAISPTELWSRLYQLSQSPDPSRSNARASTWGLSNVYGPGITGDLSASWELQGQFGSPASLSEVNSSTWDENGIIRTDGATGWGDSRQIWADGGPRSGSGLLRADDNVTTPIKVNSDGKVSAESVLWADSAVWADGSLWSD